MDEASTDVIQGTLDMLILKTLSLEPMHGFGIARRVEQVSRGVFKVNPGSLLVALQRLERAGMVDGEWRQTENGRRARFYTLTRAGRRQLDAETAQWTRRAGAIARLQGADGVLILTDMFGGTPSNLAISVSWRDMIGASRGLALAWRSCRRSWLCLANAFRSRPNRT